MNKKFDSFDGVCFFNGLIFYAPVALLIRLNAGVSNSTFFVLQAILSIAICIGEIPTGLLTDKIGYKKSIVISEFLMALARILMLGAFLTKSLVLFVIEALVEGIGNCFSSGTNEAYLYSVYGEDEFVAKTAHSANFGTAGFIVSTICYAAIYKIFGMEGLLVATVLSGIAGLVFSIFLRKEESVAKENEKNETVKLAQFVDFFKKPATRVFLVTLSAFSIVWILINFFFVERLIGVGISEEWMSVIILVYSAIQMLSEPILGLLKRFSKHQVYVISSLVAGIFVILFGLINNVGIVIAFMCVLPLIITIPEYLLSEQENKLIDESGMEENRAASLSVLNMAVNVVEIVALFSSALLCMTTIKWFFAVIGIVMIVCAIRFWGLSCGFTKKIKN